MITTTIIRTARDTDLTGRVIADPACPLRLDHEVVICLPRMLDALADILLPDMIVPPRFSNP